jgi:hypothetical protein
MIRSLAIRLLAVVVLSSGAQAREAGPSVDEMVRYFDTIVFGAELPGVKGARVVAKWPADKQIDIKLQGRFDKEKIAVFVKHLREVAQLTRLKFDVFGGPEHKDRAGAIDIVFVKRDEMDKVPLPGVAPDLIRKLASSGGCYFISARKPEDTFVKAIVVANVERPAEHLDSCLLEELIQSLGLPNDSDALRPSIFSDRDRLTSLSRVDRILVRALYDRRLPAGTPRERALEIVRPIIAELDVALPNR